MRQLIIFFGRMDGEKKSKMREKDQGEGKSGTYIRKVRQKRYEMRTLRVF